MEQPSSPVGSSAAHRSHGTSPTASAGARSEGEVAVTPAGEGRLPQSHQVKRAPQPGCGLRHHTTRRHYQESCRVSVRLPGPAGPYCRTQREVLAKICPEVTLRSNYVLQKRGSSPGRCAEGRASMGAGEWGLQELPVLCCGLGRRGASDPAPDHHHPWSGDHGTKTPRPRRTAHRPRAGPTRSPGLGDFDSSLLPDPRTR